MVPHFRSRRKIWESFITYCSKQLHWLYGRKIFGHFWVTFGRMSQKIGRSFVLSLVISHRFLLPTTDAYCGFFAFWSLKLFKSSSSCVWYLYMSCISNQLKPDFNQRVFLTVLNVLDTVSGRNEAIISGLGSCMKIFFNKYGVMWLVHIYVDRVFLWEIFWTTGAWVR